MYRNNVPAKNPEEYILPKSSSYTVSRPIYRRNDLQIQPIQ